MTPAPHSGGHPGIEQERVAEEVFLEVLEAAVKVIEAASIPYVLMGGFASAAHGRERWTHDIDFFVKPGDAGRALEALAAHGFATEATDPTWLYKAYRKGIMVDVIFCSAGGIYLDDEMLARAETIEFRGKRFLVIPPEDLLVIKAGVFKEETPRHWFDALGIVATAALDWDYLLSRARERPDKPLSLLLFARAAELEVPEHVLQKLWEAHTARGSARPGQSPEAADYVAARIHERLAAAGFEVDVCLDGERVVVTGEVTDSRQQEELGRLLQEAAEGRPLANQVTLAKLDEPAEAERIRP